jgi:DNA-binding beta-propeller fold protein YncE
MPFERRVNRAILLAVVLVVAAGVAYVWQSAGATGPALPLRVVGDYPLTGGATRFDYASVDGARGMLWLAHMGDGSVEAFDVRANRVTLTVPLGAGASVRGILAVDGKVYAAAQGLGGVVVLDARSGKRIAMVPAGDVDGLAYDPVTRRVFVSDEGGGRETVIDARTNRAIAVVALGGEAGNVQYDAVSKHVFAGVQTRDELAEIEPSSLKVIRRYALPGCSSSHSVAVDSAERAAYVGCQHNVRLVRLDLRSGRVTGSGGVGIGVDVLALDAGLHRLYVGSESGVVSAYDVRNGGLVRIAQAFLHLNAHVVAVDPATHRVYFPLQNAGGRPAMRVMVPR